MSWLDRLRGSVELTSPDGHVFNPSWSGNTRTLEKQLGVFKYPNVDREIVQDLGIAGVRYPLTLSFHGADNDLEADRFFAAFSSKNTWLVAHPTKGLLSLQPIKIRETIEPVESGSITVFETEWMHPAEKSIRITPAQIAARIASIQRSLDEAALDQLNNLASQSSAAEINALKNSTRSALSIFDTAMGAIEGIADAAEAIRRGINDSMNMSPLDLTVLGGQIQSLMMLPAKITGDVLGAIRPIRDFLDKMRALPDEVADQTGLNVMAIRELFMLSGNAAISSLGVNGRYETRAKSVEVAGLGLAEFKKTVDALDVAQANFDDELIGGQYFSQSLTFVLSSEIAALSASHVLSRSFDLSVEKMILLSEARAPIEIAITEYGSVDKFDLFVDSNNLKGDDILILPAGREVLVYV